MKAYPFLKKTTIRILCSLALFSCTVIPLHGAPLSFRGGNAQIERGGLVHLNMGNSVPPLSFEMNIVIPEWNFCSIADRSKNLAQKKDATGESWQGWIELRKKKLEYSAMFSIRDQKLHCIYELQVPNGFQMQELPLIVFSGEKKEKPTALLLGGTLCSTDYNGTYGWGNSIRFERQQMSVTIAGAQKSLSLWSSPGTFNVRIPLAKVPEKSSTYRIEFSIAGEKIKLAPPMDILKDGKKFYLQALSQPSEPELDRTEVLKLLTSETFDRKTMDRVEKFLDSRARCYSIADEARHRSIPLAPELKKAIKEAYALLGKMDFPALSATLERLGKQVAELPAPAPLTAFNPYTYLRDYTPFGFRKHPEGVFFYEPTPFDLQYQDGFRFRLLEDKRIREIFWKSNGKPDFRKIDFTEPVQDITVSRNWTGSLWRTADGIEYRFHVLTPMVDVDGVRTLTLSGFSTPPERLEYINEYGVGNAAVFKEKSVWKLNPEKILRPFLLLMNRHWTLALLPGARPTEVSFEKGILKMSMTRKSYVGIVKLPTANLHPAEYPRQAELFAEIAAAPPVSVRERVKNGKATYIYTHKKRKNDWNLKPRPIAPVPPLMTLAGADAPNAVRTAKYPMKYGLWQFANGSTITCTIPRDRTNLPVRRGVNVYYRSPEDLIRQYKDGAHWVRLHMGREKSRPPEEVWSKFEQTLKTAAEHRIPLLIDPHHFSFDINYGKSFPPDGTGQKRYVETWERLAKLCSRYPEIIVGYDLYNEPGAKWGSEKIWNELETRCIAAIRKHDAKTPIYLTGIDMGNPSGYFSYLPPEFNGTRVVTFHFYTPHSFTHQKVSQNNAQAPGVFYPGYVPEGRKVYLYGDALLWFDRWSLGAALAPILEFHAEFRLPMHCGEFGVVGWANRSSEASAICWTRDVTEILEHAGFSWHLWNGGFGMGNRFVRKYMHELWQNAEHGKTR